MIEEIKKLLEQIDVELQKLPDKKRITIPDLFKKCKTQNISDLLFSELVRFYISGCHDFTIYRGRYGGIGRTNTINPSDFKPTPELESLVSEPKES